MEENGFDGNAAKMMVLDMVYDMVIAGGHLAIGENGKRRIPLTPSKRIGWNKREANEYRHKVDIAEVQSTVRNPSPNTRARHRGPLAGALRHLPDRKTKSVGWDSASYGKKKVKLHDPRGRLSDDSMRNKRDILDEAEQSKHN